MCFTLQNLGHKVCPYCYQVYQYTNKIYHTAQEERAKFSFLHDEMYTVEGNVPSTDL
jgi:hypothetical protein